MQITLGILNFGGNWYNRLAYLVLQGRSSDVARNKLWTAPIAGWSMGSVRVAKVYFQINPSGHKYL